MKHKCDIEIAKRSYDFFIEKFGSVTNDCKNAYSQNTKIVSGDVHTKEEIVEW